MSTQCIFRLADGCGAFSDLSVSCRHRFDALFRPLLDGGDQISDFFRRLSGAFGEFAHFVGDDGKAPPLFACPCRFNGGVQRQQIRLLGDVGDRC
jgi:hypothetical protein